jgi:hypothetical protein
MCVQEALMRRRCRPVAICLIVLAVFLLAPGCAVDEDQGSLFQEDFDSQRGEWGSDQGDDFERGYEGGEYFIELRKTNWFAWTYPGKQFEDVCVEMDVYLASGSPGGHFGALCRHVDVDNFYYFGISSDGYYAIFRRADGGDLEVISGEGIGMLPSPIIKTGGEVNHVSAVCKGDELSLYVNGELLETVSDDTHTQGDVGLGAGSGPEGGARVRFDDFVVTRP